MRLGTQKRVAKALGTKSRATLYRIRKDPALNFPPAIIVRGRVMFDMDAVERWIAGCPRVVALPARKRKAPSATRVARESVLTAA